MDFNLLELEHAMNMIKEEIVEDLSESVTNLSKDRNKKRPLPGKINLYLRNKG